MLASSLLAVLPLIASVSAHPISLSKRFTRARIVSGRDNKCLTAPPKTGVGAEVFSGDCSGALLWTINPGSGSIFLGDESTGLALDAGENPHNNGGLKVWTSYPGLFQQT